MSLHRSVSTALAVLCIAAPLAAQGVNPIATPQDQAVATVATPPVAAVPDAGSAPSLAPTYANVSVGVRTNVSATPLAPEPFQDRVGRNPAMMIVGAAALVVGAVIQSSNSTAGIVLMVGGTALGLYGLWQYLK